MSADLHLHIFEGITEEDLAAFFVNTIDSKYWAGLSTWIDGISIDDAYDRIVNTPQIWVGEVSWLKAAMLDNSEDFVPSAVQAINARIGEDLPVIDDDLITDIVGAFDLENITTYELASPQEIRKFLEEHKGKRIFTVSW